MSHVFVALYADAFAYVTLLANPHRWGIVGYDVLSVLEIKITLYDVELSFF